MRRPAIVLGIETSCDDTCLSIIDATNKRILHSSIHRSLAENEKYGGIHPVVARNSHANNIDRLIAQTKPWHSQVDLIAVTTGPGMAASLQIGVDAARELASQCRVPLIGVHHMQAHALTSRFLQPLQFPFLTLLVSGGHTLLLHSRAVADHEIIADTLDIAIGDYLDKIAKALKIDWNGLMPGAALEQYARKGRRFGLPRPLRARVNVGGTRHERMSFSFSGLGSVIPRILETPLTDLDKRALAAESMTVAFQHLAQKVRAGLELFPGTGSLVMAGGVARNSELRSVMSAAIGARQLIVPPLDLCSDNATMIAWTGYEMFTLGHRTPELRIRPKWSLRELIADTDHLTASSDRLLSVTSRPSPPSLASVDFACSYA